MGCGADESYADESYADESYADESYAGHLMGAAFAMCLLHVQCIRE